MTMQVANAGTKGKVRKFIVSDRDASGKIKTRPDGMRAMWDVRDVNQGSGVYRWSCSCGEENCPHIALAKKEFFAKMKASRAAPMQESDLLDGYEKSFEPDW